ncbi:hypothetical protein GCM10009858_29700 [Terrabacter carboxydivorans]|uniref:Uncharacterized protein n=1 Tax=Terrabacter carboxydivorans TaxID=619730 RepID=A0ABP5YZI1_9MICO
MDSSHDVMAASGVDWSTGPTVAAPVPPPVSSVVAADIESVGVVALDVEAAGGAGVLDVAVGSTDLEQAASETDNASASAPARSLFMEGPCQTGGR